MGVQPLLRRAQAGSTLQGSAPTPGFATILTLLGKAICILLAIVFVGCARINLPAIDPTGSRIFLPFPNTTRLVHPSLHARNGEPGIIPQPAFPSPATPPPCLAAGGGECEHGYCNLFDKKKLHKLHDHFKKRSPGRLGEIQLTPLRVVAPVGGEVVLLAGLCGDDGYYVQRQPLEWMLSPESVGQFIEVGDDSKGRLCGSLRKSPKVEKLDVDYARGRTSSRESLITRGTPNCDDDIPLLDGQTWLSISSPSEGVSRVTVLAPESELWDRRRQTATIYWVDASWQFPAPQAVRVGQAAELVTRVTRAESLVPAEGWLVQYTIVDPSVATFENQPGANVATVKVNADGQAIARLLAAPNTNGTTPVVIDVIRPVQATDNFPQLTLGRGQTVVTFSAARLQLNTAGPQTASIGEALTYTASLANAGDIDAENVKLIARWPAGVKLLSTQWQASQQVADGVIWEQGVLVAQRQLDVSLTLVPNQPVAFDVRFEAVAAQGLTAQSSVRTEVVQPTVDVRFAPVGGVAEAETGKIVQYEIDVTNTGRQALTDLRVVIESDVGLPEAYQSTNKVEQSIPMLAPGQSFPIGVAFAIRQEGQHEATLRILSSGGVVLAEKQTSVRGLPPKPKQPGMEVDVRFTERMLIGQRQNAEITVRNTGELPLTKLMIEIRYDGALVPEEVDSTNLGRVQTKAGSIDWTPQDLGIRQIAQLRLGFRAASPANQAVIVVQGQSAENAREAKQTSVAISPGRASDDPVLPPGTGPEATTPQQRSGTMKISIFDFDDPVEVGKEARYGLRITNDQNLLDRNVRVQLRLPQGVQLRNVSRDGVQVRTNFANGQVELESIATIRQRESIDYIAVIVPTVPGQITFAAQVFSEARPQPVQVTETTTVNARQ